MRTTTDHDERVPRDGTASPLSWRGFIEKVPIICLLSVSLTGIAILFAFLLYERSAVITDFGVWRVMSIDSIFFLSGLVSGLSGFGFSAIGAAGLIFLPPILGVPLLQALSMANQLLSVGQLREEMPKSFRGLWKCSGPCIIGGLLGVPIGIWLLNHLPTKNLILVFGTLLVLYSAYSIFKPAGVKIHGFDGPGTGASIGFLGGTIGGFTAFPAAPVVVWTSLRNLPKAQNRRIVQPFIIVMQAVSIVTNAVLHPNVFGRLFWTLFAETLPAVLPGTLSGVLLYRRISDVNFKRISFVLIGLSGAGLLLKILI